MRTAGNVTDFLTNQWALLGLAILFAFGVALEGAGILPYSTNEQVVRVFTLAVLSLGALVVRQIYRWVEETRLRVEPGFDVIEGTQVNAQIDSLANEVSARKVTFIVSGLRYSIDAVESLLRKKVAAVHVICPNPANSELFLSPSHRADVERRLKRIADQGAQIHLSPNAAMMRAVIIKGSSDRVILGWYRNENDNSRQVATHHLIVHDTCSEAGRSLLAFAEGFAKQTLTECPPDRGDVQGQWRSLLSTVKRMTVRWRQHNASGL